VDLASVMLEGASPSQWNLTSSGDLILKFPLQEVLSGLDQRLLRQVTIAAATAAPAASAVTLADVVAAVLGETGRLDDAAIAGVDRAGNGNGALDLGDLRALVLVRRAERAAVVLRVGSSAALSDLRVLVVTGSLGDGTRFIGEDDLAIMNGGN
jgi:hypothetical protein